MKRKRDAIEKKYSLKYLMCLFLGLSVCIPFFLIGCLVISLFKNRILESYALNNRIILQSMSGHFESQMDTATTFFLQYLFDDDISRFYRILNRYPINEDGSSLEYFRAQSKYRMAINKYMTTGNGVMDGIGFIPARENSNICFWMGKYDNSVQQYQAEKILERNYLERIKNAQLREILFFPKQTIQNKYDFMMVKAVNHIETATRWGYVCINIPGQIFADILEQIQIPEKAVVLVLFPDGKTAYTSKGDFQAFDREATDDKEYMGEKIRCKGETYYGYSIMDSVYGFRFIYLLPQSVIFKESAASAVFVLILCFTALVIAVGLFTQMIYNISTSVDGIMNFIRNYNPDRKRNMTEEKKINKIREFSDIEEALYKMADRIDYLIKNEFLLRMAQQKAEYEAMQAEINPHFFNNVMNSMMALNRMDDKKGLERSIVCLSRMFRYTCMHDYQSTVKDESNFVNQYLALESIRFEKRLRFTIEIEEEVENFKIPKLLFQPIVENAMKHGLKPNGETLSIILKAIRIKGKKCGYVWIAIGNNGVPFKPGKKGVGLSNVQERLEIVYPESAMWFQKLFEYDTVCCILIKDRS